MRYRCLVVDHDDTVVNSTATVHFPCFLEYLEKHFPAAYAHGYTLEEYLIKNFDPGVTALFRDEIGMNEQEMLDEQNYWNNYVQTHIPVAFDGMRELLCAQKEQGGLICVDSHSMTWNILRDYRVNNLPEPDFVFGWDVPPEQRKPSPYSIELIMEKFNLRRDEILLVDDLKPGYDMARSAGIDFAAAGWSYNVEPIESFMRKHSDFYFKTIAELREFLEL